MGIFGWQGPGNKNISTLFFFLRLKKEEIKPELAN